MVHRCAGSIPTGITPNSSSRGSTPRLRKIPLSCLLQLVVVTFCILHLSSAVFTQAQTLGKDFLSLSAEFNSDVKNSINILQKD